MATKVSYKVLRIKFLIIIIMKSNNNNCRWPYSINVTVLPDTAYVFLCRLSPPSIPSCSLFIPLSLYLMQIQNIRRQRRSVYSSVPSGYVKAAVHCVLCSLHFKCYSCNNPSSGAALKKKSHRKSLTTGCTSFFARYISLLLKPC